VSTGGFYTWNTTNKTLAPAPLDTYYSTQVIVTASHNGVAESSTAVDFFLRITSQNNNPPAWSTTTPADGTIIQAVAGQPVTLNLGATDPDTNDVVTLAAHNAPAGSTFTTTPAHAATGTFTWTPTAVGQSSPINFTATDQNGLAALQRSVTIVTSKAAPVLTWPSPASIVYGTALSSVQLDAALSTAPGAPTPPHPGTFTYTPDLGSVPHGGTDTLSVTWNPDAADADTWAPVTTTQTLQVAQAGQTLSFQPPVDDSLTHTYGDPDFAVTAVSDAGLPVTYSVGAGDACTRTPQADGSTLIHFTDAGSCTLSVDQPGNGDYLPAATLTHSFTAAKQAPTLSLSPAGMVYGDHLGDGQLHVDVSPADALGHGSIHYLLDGAPAQPGTVLTAGQHLLRADFYADDSSDYNSATASVMFFVAQATQQITFDPIADHSFGDAPFPVSESATSGDAVTLTSATPGVCSVTGAGLISIQHAGDCTLDADQGGDANYQPAAQAEQTFTVDKAAQSITFAAPADMTYGDSEFTPAASGGDSGQPVTFASTTPTVCSTDNDGEVTIESAGQCTITASQAGNDDYAPAADVTRSFTIDQAVPPVSWSAPAAIDYGTALGADQLDATDGGVPGTFSYTLDDGTDATGAVLEPGDHTLHATFHPDSPYDVDYKDVSLSVSLHVRKAAQTLTWTSVPTSATYGDAPFTIAADGGKSGNDVVYGVTDGSACTISGAAVTITGAGGCVVTADQAGNGEYLDAAQITQSVTVAQRTPGLAWATPAHISYGTALDGSQLDASVTPDEAANNGTLTYTVDAGTADAAGQVLNAGSHTLHVTYTPNVAGPGVNYTSASSDVTLQVDQAVQAISFAKPADVTFGDAPVTLSASGGDSGNPVTFTAAPGSACSTSGPNGATVTFYAAGVCTISAYQLGNGNYAPADQVTRTFQVNQAPQTISFAGPSGALVGDKPLTLSASGGGSGNPVTFAASPAATCTTTTAGVLTITGPGTCSVTASQAGSPNYLSAAPVTRTFAVAYRVCTLTDLSRAAQSGSTVPITVQMCGSDGTPLANAAPVVVHAVSVDSGPATAAGNSQPGNNFRYDATGGGTYQYNLKTTGLASGSHQFAFTVGADPTTHTLTVLIK
jgi:hypothetical protein